ncbi:MAG: UDP-N-acetylglucosamine 2-epimerase [Thermomicrobiales bacterium]
MITATLNALCDHILLHTGYNHDPRLSDIFFAELGMRPPDRYLGVRGATFGEQIGQILAQTELAMRELRPDRLLILGDTNSALSAFIIKRMGIPVSHAWRQLRPGRFETPENPSPPAPLPTSLRG